MSYEDKVEAKRDRYREMAETWSKRAEALYQSSTKMAEAIPMGQPILVGHHSERRDRNYRAKIGKRMDASIEAQKKADYYAKKAEKYGTSGISSDDENAIEKLRAKVAKLQSWQAEMKAINKICRSKQSATLKRHNLREQFKLSDENILKLLTPKWSYEKPGFQSWELQNNNARIRSTAKRIVELEDLAQIEEETIESSICDLVLNKDENRVQLVFPGKPSAEVRKRLKSEGFRWSPKQGAYQRQLNERGINVAKWLIADLEKEAA